MESTTTEARVLGVIQGQIKQRRIVKMTDSLKCDLGRGAIDILEIAMSVEWEFDIDIPDEEIKKCLLVSELVSLVKTLQ